MTAPDTEVRKAPPSKIAQGESFARAELFRIFAPLLVVMAGMLVTHFFFTWMVHHSGKELYESVQRAMAAGYLPVPNTHILPSLEDPGTAFKGALFFTLTLGIALPLLVYLAVFAWEVGYRRSRKFLIVLSGFVIFLIVRLNSHGFTPFITLWFLSTYFIVFKLSSLVIRKTAPALSIKGLVTHLILLGIFAALLILTPASTNFFITVRDHFLLSNNMGAGITDYYYRYSPYPTEATKPLSKKQLKICSIHGDFAPEVRRRVSSALIRYNYLPVPSQDDDGIIVSLDDSDVISFSVDGRRVLVTSLENFIESPWACLKKVSQRSDRNQLTRRLLAFSLLYGLPLFAYILLFSLFRLICLPFPFRIHGFYIAAAGCLLTAAVSTLAFHASAPGAVAQSDLKAYLASPSPNTRTVALKEIAHSGLDPDDYLPVGYASPPSYVPERIWWTISLAGSESPHTTRILLELLDDPNPLVACKAYNALGERGYKPAIGTILQKIGTSRHWYVQGYAYQALRSLGWKQSVSN